MIVCAQWMSLDRVYREIGWVIREDLIRKTGNSIVTTDSPLATARLLVEIYIHGQVGRATLRGVYQSSLWVVFREFMFPASQNFPVYRHDASIQTEGVVASNYRDL